MYILYMKNSKFLIDKLGKLLEQGMISTKDLSSELLNILRSKRDEIIFKMKITSKEETDILTKRIEKLENRILKIEKKSPQKKIYKGKIILTLKPLSGDFSKKMFPP